MTEPVFQVSVQGAIGGLVLPPVGRLLPLQHRELQSGGVDTLGQKGTLEGVTLESPDQAAPLV